MGWVDVWEVVQLWLCRFFLLGTIKVLARSVSWVAFCVLNVPQPTSELRLSQAESRQRCHVLGNDVKPFEPQLDTRLFFFRLGAGEGKREAIYHMSLRGMKGLPFQAWHIKVSDIAQPSERSSTFRLNPRLPHCTGAGSPSGASRRRNQTITTVSSGQGLATSSPKKLVGVALCKYKGFLGSKQKWK